MRCRHLLLLVSLVVLAAISSGAVAEPEATPSSVSAALEWEPGRMLPLAKTFVPFGPEPPDGLAPLTDVGDARYARIPWGDGAGLSLALDLAPGRERLWIDLDRDGDLRDETRTAFHAADRSGTRTEIVPVTYEGRSESVPVRVQFARAATWKPDRVRILAWVHRRGEVVLAGRVRSLALVDDNSDLRFDDPECDYLYLDVDGDGRFLAAKGSHERIALGVPFRVGAEGWRARVPETSGATVLFERVAEPPPPAPRQWSPGSIPVAGAEQEPPEESFQTLADRVEAERAKPYADRLDTIRKLGRLGTEPAFDLLLTLVRRETNAAVAAAAARALGNPAYLTEGGQRVRELSASAFLPAAVAAGLVQALHGMDDPERERTYRMLLGGNEVAVVGAAAKHLVYLGTPKAREEVLAEWDRRSQDKFRYQVYVALRALPDGPSSDLMLEAAHSRYASMAARALRDLALRDHPSTGTLARTAALREPLSDVLARAVTDVLAQEGSADGIRILLALAANATPAVEIHVAKALAPIRDPQAVDALVVALKAKPPRTRTLAAQVLAGVPEPRVTDALLGRVRRERDMVALESILEALGDHADQRSVDLLLGRAKLRKSEVRHAAIRALARVGLDHPKVRKFFAGLLGARRWEDRILAIDAAAWAGDPRLCAKVIPSLKHDRRRVRLAAVEAMARLRCPRAIEPLIQRLEQEEEVRVVAAAARALYRITGVNNYDDARVWREWWAAKADGFRLPATVPPLPPADAGGTRAGFYGIPVRSGRAIFVLDQSGSMNTEDPRPKVTDAPVGNRLNLAIREVLSAVAGMGPKDYANVILFHTTVHPWREELQRLTPGNRHDLASHLKGKKPAGGTNLYDGLEKALLDPEVDSIFLLSDGMPGAGKFTLKDDILRAVRRINQTRRIAIHTVSIGRDSDLLRRLSDENGGQYVRR